MRERRSPGRRREWLAAVSTIACVLALGASSSTASEFVYVADANNNGPTAGYAIGTNGSLTALPDSPFSGADESLSMLVTPNGKYLYSSDSTTPGGIAGFSIAGDGDLTSLSGSPFPSADGPSMLALTPGGRYLYAPAGVTSLSAFAVGGDGSLTQVPGSPFSIPGAPCGAAVSPDGAHLYVTTSGATANSGMVYAFTIGADGAVTAIPGSPYPSGSGTCAVTITPDGGYLYSINVGSVAAFSVAADGSLHALTVSPFTAVGDSDQAAISPDGARLYVADQDSGQVSVFTIGAGGGLTEISASPFTAGPEPIGVALTPDGRYAYTANYQQNGGVSGFAVGAAGGLTALSSSPFTAPNSPDWIAVTPDQGPVASFSARAGAPGAATTFNGSGSSDSGGTIVSYDWSFGDGDTNTGAGPAHVYRRAGRYMVTLTVTDNAGCSTKEIFTGQTALCNGGSKATSTEQITIAANPSARIAAPRGAVFVEGARVGTTFSCRDGAFGPGLASCRDSGGRRSPHGRLDTRGGGRHTYRVTAVSKDGQRASATISFIVRPLRILALRAAPHAFVAATSGPTVAGRADAGTSISYVDTFAARSSFRVLRCASRSCARRVLVGSFAHRDRAGRNRLHFTGRVGGRALAPGRYVVDAVAALAGQHSEDAAVVIVVRPPPAVCVDPDHDGDCDAPGQP
jgi:6-phosphogluconolactonase (cycloisomerase 2 family)